MFTIEYLARLWSITEDPAYSHPARGRLRWAVTPMALVDLLAVVPFYLPLITDDFIIVRILRLFRLMRIFKLGRYFSALRLITSVFRERRGELAMILALLGAIVDMESTHRQFGAMAQIHLVVGPVGAGKSTFALQLCREHNAVRLTLDEWMTALFRRDRPEVGVMEWYVERTKRCIEQIWRVAQSVLHVGRDVVLEIGLIQQRDREDLYARVDAQGLDLIVYVLDAPRELRRKRVLQRNLERGTTFSMEVPSHIFELASDMWEPLTEVECNGRDVRFLFAE